MQPTIRRRLTEAEAVFLRAALDGRRQTWLAQRTGMDATMLSHILARRRRAPEDFLARVAAALGLPGIGRA